jgi:transcriptional regulator with AAA-type ATPase domain
MNLKKLVQRYRRFDDVPLVLMGPPGVGKSALAKEIHDDKGEFVRVNCSQHSEELLTAELFGTAHGAFTGAVTRPGKVALADGGTLFLDEAGELTDRQQAMLNTFLDTGQYTRVGEDRPRAARLRLILADWRPPSTWMRRDLLDRFGQNIVDVPAPSREELAVAIEDWSRLFRERHHLPHLRVDTEVVQALLDAPGGSYRPPRSRLETAMMDAVLDRSRTVTLQHLPPPVVRDLATEADQAWVQTHLDGARGSARQAARNAGVSPSTFYRRLRAARQVR